VHSTKTALLGAMIVCAWAAAVATTRAQDGKQAQQQKKKPVPLYTDEDLQRVSPSRGQTGGDSEPASAPEPAAAEPDRNRARGEAYWRAEVDRLNHRLQPLRERVEQLRGDIDERRRAPGVRPYSDPRVESLQRRLAALEQRIRDAEDRLHERARREGALPGWLR
jgi:hypothetical protein